MRKFPVTYMRGGTSKGLIFLENDLPENHEEWSDIFNQCMGNPNPSQIDGMGGCVSSNNKIVVVRVSENPDIDVEYLIVQSVVGKTSCDYKSNCGNMTSGTAAYAVEMGLVKDLKEPVTTVRMLNLNTNKRINVEVPVKDRAFNNIGDCSISGIDGTAGELKVNFLDPAGSKTGKLFPTGATKELLDTEFGSINVTILDVANPLVLIKAEDIGVTGTELPAVVNSNTELGKRLEAIRSAACVKIGLAKNPKDATDNNPGVPKIAFFTKPCDYVAINGTEVKKEDMDVCLRVISVFQCHKSTPLTTACAVSVAAKLPSSIMGDTISVPENSEVVRIGHPSGVIAIQPYIDDVNANIDDIHVSGVAIIRTARRIMDGTIYIKD